MKTRIMSLVLVLLSIPIFAQIQSIQVTDNTSHLNVTINGNTRSIPKRDLNLQYVDPNITLSMNGTRIFKIDNHTLVTVPTSTSIVDLNNKLIALLKENTGGGPETDPTVPADVKSLTSADVASFKAAAIATTNGSFVNTTGTQTGIAGSKTWTGFHSFQGQLQTPGIATATVGFNLFQSNSATNTFARFHSTTGGLHLQAPGAAPTANTNQLTVDGTTLLNGLTTSQTIQPDGNNTRDIGTTSNRFNSIYASLFASPGSGVFGTTAPTSAIYFRQGGQFVQGYHPSGGGGFVQAPGVAPSVNGFMWSVYGASLTTGRADFTGSWADNGQATFGSIGQAGRIVLWNGTTGTTGLELGFASSTSVGPIIQSNLNAGLLIRTNNVGSPITLNASSTSSNINLQINGVTRLEIKPTGIINYSNVPTYADNAAATTGGLAVGDVYRTATGSLMIRF